jgi:exopolysaccharide production protein ExoZ
MMVVALHASTVIRERLGGTQEPWWSGAAGVDIFFVISGFVMALSSRPLARTSSPGFEFMKRRVERIAPLYWLFTTLRVVLLVVAPAVALHGLGSTWHVAASYLFIPSYSATHEALPVLSVGWTLNFEMLFYVLFAAALALRIPPLKLIAPMLIGLTLTWAVFPRDSVAVLDWGNPIILEFLFGMLLYEAWERRLRMPQAVAWITIAASSAALQTISWGWSSPLRPLVWGVPATMLLMALLSLEERLGNKAPRWMLEIGDASYSIYLTHTFVVPVIAAAFLRLPFPALRGIVPVVAISLVTSAGAGVVVYRSIEVPIMDYFRKRRQASVLAA